MIDKGVFEFNHLNDDKYLKADEIEYMINLLRYSTKNFKNIEMLKPIFNKSLSTLEKIMDELMLGYLFDRMSIKILDISPENTLKILLRCKSMLLCRSKIAQILQVIEVRESKLKDLNYFVIQGGLDKLFVEFKQFSDGL